MTRHRSVRAFVLLATVGAALLADSSRATSITAPPAAGHWEGRIEVPGSPFDASVNLSQDAGGAWHGDLSIPAQGMDRFPLAELTVADKSVSFKLAGIAGDPTVAGEVNADGSLLDATFSQSGQQFPLRLTRKGDAPASAAAPAAKPVSPEMAKALTGAWDGLLPFGNGQLRMTFNLAPGPDGSLGGKLDSPDQGTMGMPLTGVSVDGKVVRAEMSYAGAAFVGSLGDDGKQLLGTFRQGGVEIPLTLQRRADGAPAPPPAPSAAPAPSPAPAPTPKP